MGYKKEYGQYMTPDNVTSFILDSVGYKNDAVLSMNIMEPSFGDGVFIIHILERILLYTQSLHYSVDEIKDIIISHVFGVEKDIELYQKALHSCDELLRKYGINDINLTSNLLCGDTLLLYKKFVDKMDFVVGNPPYIRIHNIPEEYRNIIREFRFSDGIFDMYIIFYEIGLLMLNNDGKLGYISPNSFLKNISQQEFRNYLICKQYISSIYNFTSLKIFDKADTYTGIFILDRHSKTNDFKIKYVEGLWFDSSVEEEYSYDEFNAYFYNKSWILGNKKNNLFLNNNQHLHNRIKDIAFVQNGIATNKDSVYIHNVYCDSLLNVPYTGDYKDSLKTVYIKDNDGCVYPVESTILRKCVKASRFDGDMSNSYVIFPYMYDDKYNCVPIEESVLKDNYSNTYQYLKKHYEELLSRDIDNKTSWYLFGRSQGLRNLNKKKIIFKHIINKNNPEIIPYVLDEDVVVYSGIYIVEKNVDSLKNICYIILSDEFKKYCLLCGKDMSGGYVGVSAKIVKEFGIK